MRRKGLLIIGLVLLIAAAGVVYAHWRDSLLVDVDVTTGSIDVIWQEWGTDDDGIPGNDPSESDIGGITELYDYWEGTEFNSSADPMEMWRCTGGVCSYLGGSLDRYDKDVAMCTVVASADQKTLTATISNAYPSYHCTVFSQMSNEGSVPVKMTAFSLTTPAGLLMEAGTEWVPGAAGTTAECNASVEVVCPLGIFIEIDGDLVPIITFDFADGTTCSHQLDPYVDEGDDMDLNAVWFHVEQAASPDTTYDFSWQYDFVNWNEWDPSMCAVWINGTCYGDGCPTVTTNGGG